MRALLSTVVTTVSAVLLGISTVAAQAPGAALVSDIRPAGGSNPWGLTRVGERVYFSAHDGSYGRELWVSDGTAAGTGMVRDIRPGSQGSAPEVITRVGSRVFFTANDGSHGRELWSSDGTRAGTRLVKDLTKGPRGSETWAIESFDDAALFDIVGRGLFRTDGTAKSTRLVHAFWAVGLKDAAIRGTTLFLPAEGKGSAAVAGTAATSTAASPSWRMTLWKTDGTKAGTKRILGKARSASGLTTFKGRVYFGSGKGSRMGLETPALLWWTNGTKSGTQPLGKIQDPSDLTVMAGGLYLNGSTNGTSWRLFRGDGSATGMTAVSPRVGSLRDMLAAAGRLWAHRHSQGQHDPDELWVSDGTSAGSRLVYGGSGDWFVGDWDDFGAVGLGGRLYFAAGPRGGDEGAQTDDTELWTSDGTTGGTVEVADVNAAGSSEPRELTRLGDAILFTATDGEHGRELWRLDP